MRIPGFRPSLHAILPAMVLFVSFGFISELGVTAFSTSVRLPFAPSFFAERGRMCRTKSAPYVVCAALHEADNDKATRAKSLQEQAERAAAEADEAAIRAKWIKDASPNAGLVEAARKYKQEKESSKLKSVAAEHVSEASRLVKAADEAAHTRGTSTLSQKLIDESRAEFAAADEAERLAGRISDGGAAGTTAEGAGSQPLSYESVVAELKTTRLTPLSPSRADVSKEVMSRATDAFVCVLFA